MFAAFRGGVLALVALSALPNRAVADADSTRAAPGARPAPTVPAPADSVRLYRLDPLQIRAHRLPDPLDPFPLASTTLGANEIARRPGENVDDLLREVAGVRLSSRGLPEAGGSLSIRGSTTDEVVVLVDGRRISTAQGGGADVAEISLDSVESVEVLRGGASALYGPDALGGAIDIRTKPVRPGARARLAGGSFGERAASGAFGVRGGPWGARLAGRTYRTDGDFPFRESDTGVTSDVVNGDLRRSSGEVRAERNGTAARLVVDGSVLDEDRGVPGSEEFPTPTARLADRRYTLGASLGGNSAQRFGGDVSFLQQTRRYTEPGAAFGAIDEEHTNTRLAAEGSFDHAGTGAALRAAAGAATDRLESTADGDRHRDTADLRVQASSDRAAGSRIVRLVGAARLDAVAGYDPFLSPRVGLLMDAVPRRVRVSASAGLAYRAPSFDELFWPPRASAAGDSTLRAERGRDAELAVRAEELPREGRLSLVAFARDVRDLIQWLPGPDGVWRPRNLGDARLWGLEADASLRVPAPWREGIQLTASGTWLRSQDRTGEPNVDGRDLVYRPGWTGALGLRVEDALAGSWEALARGASRAWVTRANTKSIPAYVVVDLRWRRAIALGLGADVTVTNVGDVSVRDFRDYPLPGRAVTVGLSWESGRS